MKKTVVILLVIIGLVVFFFPKNKYIGCANIVCLEEEYEKVKMEEEKTICLGFRGTPISPPTDVSTITCYGIFIN